MAEPNSDIVRLVLKLQTATIIALLALLVIHIEFGGWLAYEEHVLRRTSASITDGGGIGSPRN